MFEFHISRQARDRYRFDDALFSTSGNVIFANLYAVRLFADRVNRVRDVSRHPEVVLKAGDINAMGIIDEALHYVVELFRKDVNPQVMQDAYAWVASRVGKKELAKCLALFVQLFPPVDVYKKRISAEDYLKGESAGIPNTLITLEEMLLLWLANGNPAFAPFLEFFDDRRLKGESVYLKIMDGMEAFFQTQPTFGPYNNPLVTMLREPVVAAPDSLQGQLDYIRKHWGKLLAGLLFRILGGMDLLREERKQRFFGKGPSPVLTFGPSALEEIDRFSPDIDWMPRVVLMAKSTYVWLDQLSKKYGRTLYRIDQIPDAELEILARWGFTALWLIGVWERSPASKKIKRISGNPEAESSAYSVYDYTIANDLGGEEAFQSLKERTWRYGIRLATDMVPNHMGIYSRWVIEHPDWFIQLPYPPFPSYSFSGVNLSDDDRVELYIEDGYWDRRDAAVVFKRVDRHTGEARYIYHGNDGTHMPWNDTAQLDHLKQEVRQAVVDLTLHVASKFSIIRFDAAMTLAKKHFQRLWYPVPGYGGDIPSRALQGISNAEFNRCFPVEFWRELVDRVAREAPNTLLLAEAFWLMEGYFVRSLGMHRVYNSAFMNMLKAEENSKYRDVIKNVLKFNPEILRRFVNFMNNPDEEPALEQFGKGDKYFGVATMMVTLPGLPMFGHGQVEGFAEKYGMEYRKAYWKETIDGDLVRRHEQEIFPIMRKRHLFSGVEEFVLYDVMNPEGWVNEDVFAYSNMSGDERALVVYNNRYAEAKGWIRNSVGMNVEFSGKRRIIHKSLGEGIKVKTDGHIYYLFQDHKTGLEYIRQGKDLAKNGLFIHLGAYKANVFLNFREVIDDAEGNYKRLAHYLAGRGVPDITAAFMELYLEKILIPFREITNAEMVRSLMQCAADKRPALLTQLKETLLDLLGEIKRKSGGPGDAPALAEQICALIDGIPHLVTLKGLPKSSMKYLKSRMPSGKDPRYVGALLMWAVVHRLGAIAREEDFGAQSRSWMDEWLLSKVIRENLEALGYDEGSTWYMHLLLKVLTRYQDFDADIERDAASTRISAMLVDTDVRQYLQVNEFEDVWWFNREAFENLIAWLFTISVLKTLALLPDDRAMIRDLLAKGQATIAWLEQTAYASEYKVELLIDLLGAYDHEA